jgi:phospholipid transport system substrate-binding protein
MRRISCLLLSFFLLSQVAVADVKSEVVEAAVVEVKSEAAEVETESAVTEVKSKVVEAVVVEVKSEVVEAAVVEVKSEAAEVETEAAEVETEAAEVETEAAEVETEAAEVKAEVAEVKAEVADVEPEAEEKLKTSVDKVFTVLSDKELTMDQKKIKVVEITSSVFGYPLMAKLSLGKKHWSQFNSKQRAEFTSLFTGLFQDFYVNKLDLFSDEKIIFKPPIIVSKKKVQIPTVLLSKEKKYSMRYKMSKTKNGWRIYDIEIEGVSLIHTYRSQYNHVLENGKIEDLLTKMREKKIENVKVHDSPTESDL